MQSSSPFESPSDTDRESTRRRVSMPMCILGGGVVGLLIASTLLIILFALAPGLPGLFEILILLTTLMIVFVLPGSAVGALVGFIINSQGRNK